MKQLILFLVFIATINTSCSNDIPQSENQAKSLLSVYDIKNSVSEITKEIYAEAWNGSAIDNNKLDGIIERNMFAPTFEESVDINTFLENLTPDQNTIINDLFYAAEKKAIDFNLFRTRILQLPENDQALLLSTIDIIEGASLGINDALKSIPLTKSWEATFLCNVTSGGIAAIYGAAIGGPAGAAVGILGSALLSTMFCD